MLEPIPDDELAAIIAAGIARLNRDEGRQASFSPDAVRLLAGFAGGDARRALNLTEALWRHFARDGTQDSAQNGARDSTHDGTDGSPAEIGLERVAEVLERQPARFDKAGDEHFNQISALHKAVRGSHVEGALYWLARMLAGGEDPVYILRRLVRMASEDIGLSDPRALSVALAANETYRLLGSPEGELAIAEATVYLATAPKSNRIYAAWSEAQAAAEAFPNEAVPTHLRNAPTRLMQEAGFGTGYRYDHDEGGFAAGQRYLPDALAAAEWYRPTRSGYEKTLQERLEWWNRKRQAAGNE
jgi:putative ATPase